MRKSSLEVADVFRAALPGVRCKLSPDKLYVAEKIINCRTAALGGHILVCDSCVHFKQSYNSCWNRHCPKCQGSVAAEWVESCAKDLLPVPYFHTVFTLPSELQEVAYQNKKVVYEIFFKAAANTLHAVAANPKFLGAKIAFLSMLHTWNQKLEKYAHLHVISPKGGISFDNQEWVSSKYNFFLPVRALSKVFRGKMIDYLRQAHQNGDLRFYGNQKHLQNPIEFEKLLGAARKTEWVVYSKKPFGGPVQVVKYFASYVHRVGISNYRLRQLEADQVTFSYRDSKNKNRRRHLTLSTTTFVQRFLFHLLPKGFTRIRHYGFLSNGHKAKYLPLAKELIAKTGATIKHSVVEVTPFKLRCPCCKTGTMTVLYTYFPHRFQQITPKPGISPLNFSPQHAILDPPVAWA